MSRLEAMELFVRIADLGSFAAAARQRGVARSVVTRRIAALEEHLGVKLLVRTTRKLTLTGPGKAYLERCRVILDLVETAEIDVMEARHRPRGLLRFSLPLSFGLRRIVPLLPRFRQMYPEITLGLDFSDRHVDLIEEGIDLSIRITTRLAPGDVARKLGEISVLTVAAPAYLAQHGCPSHPDELGAHHCLGYSARAAGSPMVFAVDGVPRQVYPNYWMEANNGDALAQVAALGLGITMQPDFIVADLLRSGRLVRILDEYAPPPVGVHALLPSNRYLPNRVRVLIDYLASELAAPSAVPQASS